MRFLEFAANPYRGVDILTEDLPHDLAEFRGRLRTSLDVWRKNNFLVVWLEIPSGRAELIPIAIEEGFTFHHTGRDTLMLFYRLVEDAFVPDFASHYIGAGGVVINEKNELLTIVEQAHVEQRPNYFKLPGGTLHPGEHLDDAVCREVWEETGIQTQFERVVCFRHLHEYRYSKSDIYFVCKLRPLTTEITIQDEEIAKAKWIPVEEYLAGEQIGTFNKGVVKLALQEKGGFLSGWIDGYDADRALREVYLPCH